MFKLPVAIESNIPFLVLLGITILAVALAYWNYRSVNPPVSVYKRRLLMGLRFIVFLMVLLLLFKPSVTLVFQHEIQPKTDVYIDNSLSMSLKNQREQRWSQVDTVLKKLDAFKTNSLWLFNTRVYPLTDSSFTISQDATSFDNLFRHIDSHDADNILLISDGNVTDGGYPVQLKRHQDKKLFTIGIGRKKKTGIYLSKMCFMNHWFTGGKSRRSA